MSRDSDVTFSQFSTHGQDNEIRRLVAEAAQTDFEDLANEACQEAYDQGYDGDDFDKPDLSIKMQKLIADDYLSKVEEILQNVAQAAFSEGQSGKALDDEASDEGEDD